MAGNIPTFSLVLTGGPGSLVPVTEAERAYFAAVSEDDPPSTAYILYTALQYPARLKAQLRENLKRQNVHVIDQVEVTPTDLEKIYANAKVQTKSNTADVDYERGRDAVARTAGASRGRGRIRHSYRPAPKNGKGESSH